MRILNAFTPEHSALGFLVLLILEQKSSEQPQALSSYDIKFHSNRRKQEADILLFFKNCVLNFLWYIKNYLPGNTNVEYKW